MTVKNHDLVSVIIVNFNAADDVKNCVAVDDGATVSISGMRAEDGTGNALWIKSTGSNSQIIALGANFTDFDMCSKSTLSSLMGIESSFAILMKLI